MMDIFAFYAAATVMPCGSISTVRRSPGTATKGLAAPQPLAGCAGSKPGTAGLDGLADHLTTYYPQSAHAAPWRAVPHRIDNDRVPRYVVVLREKKAA